MSPLSALRFPLPVPVPVPVPRTLPFQTRTDAELHNGDVLRTTTKCFINNNGHFNLRSPQGSASPHLLLPWARFRIARCPVAARRQKLYVLCFKFCNKGTGTGTTPQTTTNNHKTQNKRYKSRFASPYLRCFFVWPIKQDNFENETEAVLHFLTPYVSERRTLENEAQAPWAYSLLYSPLTHPCQLPVAGRSKKP